jgi:pseudaminic acid biosynthesis-associated methylase
LSDSSHDDAKSAQLQRWITDVGDAYLERNRPNEQQIRDTAVGIASILQHMCPKPATILEIGAASGFYLRALQRICDAELWTVEPNPQARAVLSSEVIPKKNVLDGQIIDLPFDERRFDLVFTSGVLIHIPDDELEAAYREMHRVSARWLLSIEYFNPTPVSVRWHGEDGLLVKRDYGALWLDLFNDLKYVAHGFFWHQVTRLGDATWWLFRRD